MKDATINYKIKLLQGDRAGETVELELELSDIEEYGSIGDQLINEGYLDHLTHPHEYYEVLERSIVITADTSCNGCAKALDYEEVAYENDQGDNYCSNCHRAIMSDPESAGKVSEIDE